MLQALRSVMLPAEFEAGSMGCLLSAQVDEVNSLHYREDWRTREDLEREIRSTRFGRLLAVIECADGLPTLEVHFISETQGWDYIRQLRGEVDLHGAGNGDVGR
jgi:hypothetical protein